MSSATWTQADVWIRQREAQRGPTEILGYRVPINVDLQPERIVPLELLARIDQAAKTHWQGRQRLGGTCSGRRAALKADRSLALEIHALCAQEGSIGVLELLGMSRQSLRDVWLHHGLTPPQKVNRRRGSRAGGMAS